MRSTDISPTWLKGYDASRKEDYITFWVENWATE
jgi:hypothetical protein